MSSAPNWLRVRPAETAADDAREPDDLGDLDLRGLQVRVETDDGELVAVISDGYNMIRLVPGVTGPLKDAADGARALSRAAWHYADLLDVRARTDLPDTHQAAVAGPVEAR